MITENRIENIVNEFVANTNLYLVQVQVKPAQKVLVYLDCEKGNIGIDDCEKVSRYLYDKLSPEIENYELEVSSAGLNMPFRHIQQYKKNIGQDIQILLNSGVKYTAKLLTVQEESIVIELAAKKLKKEAPTLLTLNFNEIKQTKLVIKI